MEKDAVSAGISPIGSLLSTAEIKILVCYILSAAGEPVPGNQLANILHYEGIANCFEVNDAIALLCRSGHLVPVDEKEDTYTVTEAGRSVADTLKTSLSVTVKNRAYNAAIKMMARFKNAKENKITIQKENGKCFITCSALDNGLPFMSIKLLVSDEEQAHYIKERFLDDNTIYSKIIGILTNPNT